jgi:hypothetical protein
MFTHIIDLVMYCCLYLQDRDARVLDPSRSSHSAMTAGVSTLQKQDGQRAVFVERGVGSPRIARMTRASLSNGDLTRSNSDAEVSSYLFLQHLICGMLFCIFISENIFIMRKVMPAAAGAVAAAAVADQMHEPKEHRNLAIVLVSFILLNSISLWDFYKDCPSYLQNSHEVRGLVNFGLT